MSQIDYYALLEISISASAGEIKTAYRREALRWHPDRHSSTPETQETATARFKMIQEAYEVLSDEREREWYDSHREEILSGNRGGGAGDGNTKPPASAGLTAQDLMSYFSPFCFSGMDGSKGFFFVYGKLFEKIEEEEIAARAQRKARKGQTRNDDGSGASSDSDSDDWNSTNAPEKTNFGNAKSAYPSTFYAKFLSFSTAKPFTWKEKYRLSDAPDRRIRRIMERENAKLRSKERLAYVETVRSLAAYVRKRDPRYKAFVAEQEKERLRKLEEEKARVRKEKQERMAKAKEWKPQAWEVVDRDTGDLSHDDAVVDSDEEDEEDLDSEEIDDELLEDVEDGEQDDEEGLEEEEEEEDLIPDDLYCPACEKRFANPASYLNHEGSKKHKQNVERLRKEIEKEERELAKSKAAKGHEKKEPPKAGFEEFRETEEVTSDEEEDDEEVAPPIRRRRSGAPSPQTPFIARSTNPSHLNLDESLAEQDLEDEEEDIFNLAKQQRNNKRSGGRRKTKARMTDYTGEMVSGSDGEQVAPAVDMEKLKLESESSDEEGAGKGKGKGKKPRRRKDKSERGAQQPAQAVPDDEAEVGSEAQVCLVCRAAFPSRTKLFAHVKSTGHTVPLAVAAMAAAEAALAAEGGRKGKKGKKR